MWVKMRFGNECLVFVSAYSSGSERSEEEIDCFWLELKECILSFSKNEIVVVMGDLNARVGNDSINDVMGKFGVNGVN